MRQTDLARAHPKTEHFDKTEQPPLATPVGDFFADCDVAREHGNLVNPTQLRHRRTVVTVESHPSGIAARIDGPCCVRMAGIGQQPGKEGGGHIWSDRDNQGGIAITGGWVLRR